MRAESLGRLIGVALLVSGCAQPVTAELTFELGADGLSRLQYRGVSLLARPADGVLENFARTPEFAGQDPVSADGVVLEREFDAAAGRLGRRYRWGRVTAAYRQQANVLLIELTVANTSTQQLNRLAMQIARLTYPQPVTTERVGEPPQPFAGGTHGSAHPQQRPPAVLVDYRDGALVVTGDDLTGTTEMGVYHAEGDRVNRVGAILSDLPGGATRTVTIALRFGPPGSSLTELAGETLADYARAHPCTVNWDDRRPIGKLFLATKGNGPDRMETNPNRWFMNAADLDVSTEAGKEEFRSRLLRYADGAVAALRQMNAQGAITWGIEGQRTGHTYYGDPRILPQIAPEMEYRGAADAHFRKFDEAGLLHGVCVRPQRVHFDGAYWLQTELTNSTEAVAEVEAKITYAVRRWNSRLIYVDSDYRLSAADYRELHKKFPHVLLIPEWETPLHHAFTAPLRSFTHHQETGTPPSIRAVWPRAFSVVFLDTLPQATPAQQTAIRAAVRAGDVPCINAWYVHDGFKAVRALYSNP